MRLGDVHQVIERLEALVQGFDADRCDGATASGYAQAFSRLERLAHAGKLDALARVDATRAFRHDGSGAADTAAWFAATTGTSRFDAARQTRTARELQHAQATRLALRRGELSAEQATEVARTAAAHPASEQVMLHAARRGTVEQLRAEGMRRRAATDDASQRHRLQQRRRGVWVHTDDDGLRNWRIRLTPEQNTTFEPVFNAWHRRTTTGQRTGGVATPAQLGADAVVAMAQHLRGGAADRPTGPDEPANQVGTATTGAATTGTATTGAATTGAATVHALLLADITALRRGRALPGERCEIAGVGPIDVAAARALLGDAIVDILVRDGVDVRTVAHTGRAANHTQKAALLADFECVVRGCTNPGRIEIHHLHGWAETRLTDYESLLPTCAHHHRHTHRGWRFGPPDEHGKRGLRPPPKPPPEDR